MKGIKKRGNIMSNLHKAIEDAYKYKQNINDETFKAYVAEHPHTQCVINKWLAGYYISNGIKPIDLFTIGEKKTIVFVFEQGVTTELYKHYGEYKESYSE